MFVQVAAVAGLVAFSGDYLIPFILAPFYAQYSHMRHVQSELGTIDSPVARWINSWWVLFGVFCVAFGVGFALAHSDEGAAGLSVAVLIVVFGAGAGVGAGRYRAHDKRQAARDLRWLGENRNLDRPTS